MFIGQIMRREALESDAVIEKNSSRRNRQTDKNDPAWFQTVVWINSI